MLNRRVFRPSISQVETLESRQLMSVAATHHHHHHQPPPVNQPPIINPPPTTGQTVSVTITFYGWPDNTPPGNAIAYPTPARPGAGGTGTYADPISAAATQNNPRFPVGTVIYVPDLQKYVIIDDYCVGCSTSQIDIWVGGTASSNPSSVIAREDALTGDPSVPHQVIVNPPADLPVNLTPLYSG